MGSIVLDLPIHTLNHQSASRYLDTSIYKNHSEDTASLAMYSYSDHTENPSTTATTTHSHSSSYHSSDDSDSSAYPYTSTIDPPLPVLESLPSHELSPLSVVEHAIPVSTATTPTSIRASTHRMKRRGSSKDDEDDDDLISSTSSSSSSPTNPSKRVAGTGTGINKPYDRQEYRKIRHRQTDTNRRIRIKTLLEKLRDILYTNKHVKVEQSQIIHDSLLYIEKLRNENTTLQQRLDEKEQQVQVYVPPERTETDRDTQIRTQIDNDIELDLHMDTHDLSLPATTPYPPTDDFIYQDYATPRKRVISSYSTDEFITQYRIPASLKNKNVSIWITSLAGTWCDVNYSFELNTGYKRNDLVNRYVQEYPVFVTSVIEGSDENEIESEPALGLGSAITRSADVMERASRKPVLMKVYWLHASQQKYCTRAIAQVIRDERDGKMLYCLAMTFSGS